MSDQTNKQEEMKVIKSLSFTNSEDGELMNLINTYSGLKKGITARAAIRNLLFRILPSEIQSEREMNESLKPTG